MLEVRDLVIGYHKADVVHGVTLRVRGGDAVCLLGMNGAGKSTIVKAIAGWVRARSGSISLDGSDVTHAASWKRARAGLAVVPEGSRVFRELTIEENLRLGGAKSWQSGYEYFPILRSHRRQLAGSLSGGQRQMLSVARALSLEPKYLVLDEISFGLMPQATDEIFERLAVLREEGIGLLIIEQQERRALAFCDHGYVLAQGAIVAEGTTEELASDEKVREAYLGD